MLYKWHEICFTHLGHLLNLLKSITMKIKILTAAILAIGVTTSAHASILTFDDIGVSGSVYPNYTNNGFVEQGYQFSNNMDVIDVSPSGGWWSNGVGSGHSGKFATLNDYGGPMVMTLVGGGSFSVQDLWINGWQGAPGTATITGLLNGVVTNTVSIEFGQPWTDAVLNFAQVDSLNLSATTVFLVDDISVNGGSKTVPEPATLALLGLGLVGLGFSRRRKV